MRNSKQNLLAKFYVLCMKNVKKSTTIEKNKRTAKNSQIYAYAQQQHSHISIRVHRLSLIFQEILLLLL